MQIIRSIAAVLLGYVLFGISARLLFHLTGRDPHNPASFLFMLFGTLYGAFFALLTGFVVAWISGQHPFIHATSVAIMLSLGALLSAVFSSGAAWTMISTFLVAIPMTYVGAFAWSRIQAGRSPAPPPPPDPLADLPLED